MGEQKVRRVVRLEMRPSEITQRTSLRIIIKDRLVGVHNVRRIILKVLNDAFYSAWSQHIIMVHEPNHAPVSRLYTRISGSRDSSAARQVNFCDSWIIELI